jgi:hypothetical protein
MRLISTSALVFLACAHAPKTDGLRQRLDAELAAPATFIAALPECTTDELEKASSVAQVLDGGVDGGSTVSVRGVLRPSTQVMTKEVRLDRLAGVVLTQEGATVVLGALRQPALQSGLEAGDVLLAIDGHRVHTIAEASSRIRAGGLRQVFHVRRKGVEQTVRVETWGALLGTHLLNVQNGILVLSVKPETEHLGLRAGDFLLMERSWGQFGGAWGEWPGGEKVWLLVVRQGQSRRVTLSPTVK